MRTLVWRGVGAHHQARGFDRARRGAKPAPLATGVVSAAAAASPAIAPAAAVVVGGGGGGGDGEMHTRIGGGGGDGAMPTAGRVTRGGWAELE